MQANQAAVITVNGEATVLSFQECAQVAQSGSEDASYRERKEDLSQQIPVKMTCFGKSDSGKCSPRTEWSNLLDSERNMMASIRSAIFSKRCLSLPITRSSNLSPQVSEPASGLMPSEPDETNLCSLNKTAATTENEIDSEPNMIASIKSAIFSRRCLSLPITRPSNLSPQPASGTMPSDSDETYKGDCCAIISRSLTVPGHGNSVPLPDAHDNEEIPKEQAVCRICLEVCVEGNTFKMDCSCKGALSMVHEQCVLKWFSTIRTKNCEVCGHVVKNLPVTLLRITSSYLRNSRQEHARQSLRSQNASSWREFIVLALISTICYFLFLEHLLSRNMKMKSIILAAPTSFALGVFGSMISVAIASRDCIWTYATLEFTLVAMTVHLFYSILHLHAIFAVLLAAVLGLGTAMCLNALYMQYYVSQPQRTDQ